MQRLVRLVLLTLLLWGCRSEGSGEFWKRTEHTFNSYEAIDLQVSRYLWTDAETEVQVFCGHKEKKPPYLNLDFILDSIGERPDCHLLVTNTRRNGAIGSPTIQKLTIGKADTAWTMERSTFTPPDSWLD